MPRRFSKAFEADAKKRFASMPTWLQNMNRPRRGFVSAPPMVKSRDPIQDAVDAAIGGGPSQSVIADMEPVVTQTDPVQTAVDTAVGGKGPTPAQQAQLEIDKEAWKTDPKRFIATPYWIAPNWWENRPVPSKTQPDPVQDAVDQATGGNLAQEIMAYLGTDAGDAGVYNEQYDFNKDGVVDMLDITASAQESTGLGADPVQDAVDQATGGVTAQDIMAYLGETGPFMEGMDVNKDGTVDQLDSVWQLQIQEGLRNPDGTPVAQPDPVQTAVDAAVGGGTTPPPVNEGYSDWSLEELEGVKPPPLPPNWQSRTQAEIAASNAPYYQAQREIRRREQLKNSIERGPVANIPGFGEVFSIPSGISGTSRYVDASGNALPQNITSSWSRGMHGELFIPNEYKTQRPSTPGQGYQGGVDYIDYAPGGRGEPQLGGIPQIDPVQAAVNAAIAGNGDVATTAPVFPTDTEPGTDTVGPAVNEYVSPQDQFLADYPDWATNPPTLPATPDPVQDAVDTAVGGGTKPLPFSEEDPYGTGGWLDFYDPEYQAGFFPGTGTKPSPSSYGPVDNWGEPGGTVYDPADQLIDPVESFVEDTVSPFMDEDPSTDTWTAPVVDVLETAGAGAGGDPTTDFAVVNDPTEPTTGDPYSVGVIDPNATDPVTGVDTNAPGPDPVYYDEDTGTYTDTTSAVDDMTETTGVSDMPTTNVAGDVTTTTGGFPDSPFEGMVHMDANNVTWTFVQGEWREVGPTGDTPVIGDTTTTTGDTTTVVDDTTTTGDTTVVDDTTTVVDDTTTVVDDTTTTGDTTVTGQSEIDKLNALIAELRAQQEAQQAAQQAEREAWEAQTAAATGKYTLTGPSIGYNPYVSGQYQSDPYGAAGVPDFGGITTIPVPNAWQPPTLQPWQAPAPPAQALASWLEPMEQQTPTQPSNTWGQ